MDSLVSSLMTQIYVIYEIGQLERGLICEYVLYANRILCQLIRYVSPSDTGRPLHSEFVSQQSQRW